MRIWGVMSGCVFSFLMAAALHAQEYKLVWQDDFAGRALNESANWNIEVNGDGGGNQELQYYRRENISVGKEPVSGEDCLIITAKKEYSGGKSCTSGRITSQNKMTFQYGKLEARIRLPRTANGLWPAFWLLGTDIPVMSWPKCGEIDIVEMGNVDGINAGTQDRYFNGACHWGFVENGNHPVNVRALTNPYSLQDDFHLFTMVWTPKFIKMYLDLDQYPDADPYFQMGITADATAKDPYYYFNKPYFVLFNLAVGGNFPQIWNIGQVTALNGGEAKMYVDYVRVYQKGDAGEKFTGSRITGLTEPNEQDCFVLRMDRAASRLELTGEGRIVNVTLYSLTGQQLMILHDTGVVDFTGLPDGTYILKAEDESGHTGMYKINF